ncbi:MAG: ABC transporter substrate-binding protein [Nitriliruptorales bacterium]
MMNRWTRLPLIALVLALLAAACGGDDAGTADADAGAAPEVTDVRVTQAVVSLAFLPIYVARSQGFFEDQGLSVEQIVTAGGGPDLQALLSGDAEFNAGAGNYQINAFREGQAVENVYNYMNRSIINVVMSTEAAEAAGVDADSPLDKKLAALEGLTIGVTRPGSLTDATARFLVQQAGLDPDSDVQIIGVGGGAAIVAALQQGQVEAIVISSPISEQAASQAGIMLINNAAGAVGALDPFMMENIYVRPDFAEENPNTVAAFVRAIEAANAWAAERSPEEIADAVASDFGEMDRAVLVSALTNVIEALSSDGELSEQAVENTLQMLGEQEIGVSDVLGLFNDRFLP